MECNVLRIKEIIRQIIETLEQVKGIIVRVCALEKTIYFLLLTISDSLKDSLSFAALCIFLNRLFSDY